MAVAPAELVDSLSCTAVEATRFIATSAALIEKYAPGAPQDVKDEATIRTSSYLFFQPAASISSDSAGPFAVRYNTASLSPLRASGSMALLTPWKVRRAMVIR